MTDDQIRTEIGCQILSQPGGQNITVTFADGVSFTASYCGSGMRRRQDGSNGEAYNHIELSMITPLAATINPPQQILCGAWLDADPDRPCILAAGHRVGLFEDEEFDHIDINGMMW